MVKILSSPQIRQLDAFTIENEPVSSIDLMERACRSFVQWFITNISTGKKIGVVCGTGNNGGDGLAIARMIAEWSYDVKVWVVRGSVSETEDFKVNLKRLGTKPEVSEISTADDQGLFNDRDVLIDAVFGSGLSRPPEGVYAQAIQCINKTNAIRIAVDIPSGLMADKVSEGAIVQAHYTVSFQLPKLAFFLPQSSKYTGEWVLVDIGLHKKFIRNVDSPYRYVIRKDVCKLLKKRSKFDHKGTFGHVLLVAGSYGKMGAAVLAARAVLRSGAGLLTVHSPKCGNVIMQTSCPEAMSSSDESEDFFSSPPPMVAYSSIGIGPGLGLNPKTIVGFKKLLDQCSTPIVIDADALNILSSEKGLIGKLPEGSILTPHPKEFERLAGNWKDDFERLNLQISLAAKFKCVIVLKGAYTSIATPSGKVFFNSTGNPGMATGGMGDVLTGILTGLLAQSYAPEDAAVLGVYLHGLAGDQATIEMGEEGLLPSDLIDFLPQAFKRIRG